MSAFESSPFPPVRACIFDVDGLLINSEDIYSEAMNNVLHEYGRPDLPWSVKARQQSRGRQGGLNVLEWAKLPISLDEFNAKVAAQSDLFKKSQLLPGVSDLLSNLSKRTIPTVHLAIASSAGRVLFDIKTGHLSDTFSVIPDSRRIFGNDASMLGKPGKPAPDVFLLALKRINDTLPPGETPIAPNQCLVLEDSTAGVEAGRRAGMRVVWVPHPQLLKVYRRREEIVLSGTTDHYENGGVFGAEEERDTSLEQSHELELNTYPRWSKDGWAELLTTLDDFHYEQYGFSLKGQQSLSR